MVTTPTLCWYSGCDERRDPSLARAPFRVLPPHHVRKLSLFGSALRDDFGPQSDLDFLVEFDPEHRPRMVELHEIEQELSGLYGGRRVDLVNPKFLNRRIRDRVLAEAGLQFAEG